MARRPDSLASSCQSNVPIWCSDFIHESVDGRSCCCEGQAKCVGLSIVALFESHFVVSFIFALRSPAGREMSPDDVPARSQSYSFMPFHSCRSSVLVYLSIARVLSTWCVRCDKRSNGDVVVLFLRVETVMTCRN